jgi:hypothetical protein
MVDYNLVSKPRIPYSVFERVLRSANSPAHPEALACWHAIISHGIDPAVALAQFDKESTYGKFGRATANKSWGNLRRNGTFVKYSSWAAGAADYARLLSGPLYAGSAHYHTVRTMPYRYAPSADHNNPAAYGSFMISMIQHYIALSPTFTKLFYTVVSGDTLSGIATKYRTTVARLLSFPENAQYRDNPNLIHPGDKVRVR